VEQCKSDWAGVRHRRRRNEAEVIRGMMRVWYRCYMRRSGEGWLFWRSDSVGVVDKEV
jgi:hypothetical protein